MHRRAERGRGGTEGTGLRPRRSESRAQSAGSTCAHPANQPVHVLFLTLPIVPIPAHKSRRNTLSTQKLLMFTQNGRFQVLHHLTLFGLTHVDMLTSFTLPALRTIHCPGPASARRWWTWRQVLRAHVRRGRLPEPTAKADRGKFPGAVRDNCAQTLRGNYAQNTPTCRGAEALLFFFARGVGKASAAARQVLQVV